MKGQVPEAGIAAKTDAQPVRTPSPGAVWWGGDTGDTRQKLAGGRGFLMLCSLLVNV